MPSTEQINHMLLANFYAQSAAVGKPLLAAPLFTHSHKEEPAAQKTLTIDEQFAVLRSCFAGSAKRTEPTASRLNPNAPPWVPRCSAGCSAGCSTYTEEEPTEEEPDLSNPALIVKWTKTNENGKIKRVFTRKN